MIPFLVGILILVAIFAVFYFAKKFESKSMKSKKDILEDDIVLALLTEQSGNQDYAILWNGIPNKKYEYVITHDSLEIAKGESISQTSVFKVRGIPLEQGKLYSVQVGDTKVNIPFSPPLVSNINIIENELDVATNIVPTNIEVLISSTKIPLTECQIKIDPPGFVCKIPSNIGEIKPVTVIYNGPNAVNILM